MMKKKYLLIALTALFLGACGSTSEQASTADTNATKTEKPVTESDKTTEGQEVAKADDIVCTYQQKTGSRFKKKVCLPRAVRDKLREQAQTMMRNQSAAQLPQKF